MQTWKFTVIQNAEKIHAFRQIVEKVSKEKKVHFYGFNNPKTIILVSNDRRNADGIQDSSCAVQNMMLAANSYGIGSAWINALMTIAMSRKSGKCCRDLVFQIHISYGLR